MRYHLFSVCLLISVLSFSSLQAQQNDTSKNGMPLVPGGEDKVFEKVEIEASVNMKAWQLHLITNLPPYLEEAARKGMKAGTYKVDVRFLVEKDGRITDVKALNDPGYGLALGAVRTVRTGPKWTAGEVNGQKVRSYHTQPIMFAITEK